MTARILVVDDVPANVRLLQGRLLAEYFEVLTATGGREALDICSSGRVDVVLLDVMMPEIDGFEVCRRLKADAATHHIPVVMVTALDQVSDRIRGLEAGADDFLTKPVNELQLMTRVKSLVRLKMLTDELRLRAATTQSIGMEELLGRRTPLSESPGRVLLIDGNRRSADDMSSALGDAFQFDIEVDPQSGVMRAAEDGRHECVVVSGGFQGYDPLRLCSQLRTLDRTRFLPIVLIAGEGDEEIVTRALDLGVNDYLVRPVDQQELTARLRTQVRRKRYNDRLRASVAETIEMAVTDPLTGLHNRRYLDSHLQTLFDRAVARRRSLSVMIADIDRFKSINDSLGHDSGDRVLREVAKLLRRNVRGMDLACRFGGDEFVVVMPDTDAEAAGKAAERVCRQIAEAPFIAGDTPAKVTVSVGVSSLKGAGDTIEDLMKRADVALYEAKTGGRNRVAAAAA